MGLKIGQYAKRKKGSIPSERRKYTMSGSVWILAPSRIQIEFAPGYCITFPLSTANLLQYSTNFSRLNVPSVTKVSSNPLIPMKQRRDFLGFLLNSPRKRSLPPFNPKPLFLSISRLSKPTSSRKTRF